MKTSNALTGLFRRINQFRENRLTVSNFKPRIYTARANSTTIEMYNIQKKLNIRYCFPFHPETSFDMTLHVNDSGKNESHKANKLDFIDVSIPQYFLIYFS